MRTLFPIIALFLLACSLKAQSDSINYSKTNHYFRFNYENDFFSETDRYYTQGVSAEFIMPVIRYSPVSFLLFRLNKTAQRYHGLMFRQDCFTPKTIRYDTLNYLERPYAATMYLRHSLVTIDPQKKRRLTSSIDLGIIGPCAKCKEEQIAIHTALDNIQPLGWNYQVASDYLLNYNIGFEQGLIMTKNIEIIGSLDVRGGTFYDDATGGMMMRVGFMNGYFKHYGFVKNATVNRTQFYLFAKTRGKIVGYNAVLQGGMFNKTSQLVVSNDQVERFVFMFDYGITFSYRRFKIDYYKTFISREFKRGIEHGWGGLGIGFCF